MNDTFILPQREDPLRLSAVEKPHFRLESTLREQSRPWTSTVEENRTSDRLIRPPFGLARAI